MKKAITSARIHSLKEIVCVGGGGGGNFVDRMSKKEVETIQFYLPDIFLSHFMWIRTTANHTIDVLACGRLAIKNKRRG
jgi:cell division GTPase FtsZ